MTSIDKNALRAARGQIILLNHPETPWSDEQVSSVITAYIAALATPALAGTEPAGEVVESAIADIAAERRRQTEAEGWTPEHDDQHDDNELSRAAACYAIGNVAYWPWEAQWWKPTVRRRNLVKSGALIVAEIERLDRAALRDQSEA